MNKSLIWIAIIFLSGSHCYAQEPFQSIIQNTRNSPYNYWYGSNQSLVLPLSDGGYIIKDYIYPQQSNISSAYDTNYYATARITRFNGCHNKVWSKAIDSTVSNSFLFVRNHQYPGAKASATIITAPYPKNYINLYYGNGVYGGGNFGDAGVQNNSIISTTDNCFVNCDLMAEGGFDTPPIVTKLDHNGNVLWSKKLNRPAPPGKVPVYYSQSCMPIVNGGCMVVFIGFNSSIEDTFPVPYISITKMDKDGNILNASRFTSHIYNSIESGVIENLLKMPGGGFSLYITGNGYNYDYGYGNGLARLDSNGNVIWAKYIDNYQIYYNAYYDYGGGNCVADSKGNMYIGGGSNYYVDYLNQKIPIEKLDINGKPLWIKYINDSISPHQNCAIDGIGISKDDRLAAIVSYFNTGPYPSDHSFYVKFDANDSFSFAKLIKNSSDNYFNGYNNSTVLQTTADSGYIYLENEYYSDTSALSFYSLLSKLDKNGKGTCLGKDTTITFYPGKFSIGTLPTFPDSGFKAFDTKIAIKTSNFKENMVCAPGLFPIADLGGNTVVCSSNRYTLHIGNENIGARVLWSTGDTTDSIVAIKSGIYWVSMTNGYCTSSDTAKVVFFSQTKMELPDSQSICPDDSVLLSVKDTIASYYWINPKKKIVQGNSIMARDSGNYSLMLKGTQNCSSVGSVHVKYYSLPMGTAGPDTILCYNETYTMQGSGGVTYTWHPATYLSSSTDPKAIAKLPNTEQYILVVRNSHGCQDSSPVLLKVRPPLVVKAIANNASICYGQPIILSAIAGGGDSLHYQFNWITDNLNGDSIAEKVYQSGWHKIILSDNCSATNATDSVYVTVIPPAKAVFTNIPATKIKANHNVSFLNQSTNASSYLWTFGTKDSSKLVSPVYIYTDTDDYEVILVAYGINNCPNDTAYGFIKIITDQIQIYIPNAFSPNGDGINDVFDISGIGIKNYSYNIYNRWGECIYAEQIPLPPLQGGIASNPHGWDGTFKGAQVPDGVYIYMVDVTDVFGEHHYLNGNVTLMR